ncbi:MoaD/ThiS family protein [Bacterioplanoides sp.]|uniref:MoaD/ThiS family protein n=1 Tax=Bacterioplanoides sp. TaxID=2066072 RepID=UPI003AFFD202
MKVLFFAQLRERLNCDSTELNIELPARVNEIREALLVRFPDHTDLLQSGRALVAINQELINNEATEVTASDEVAFFPPVTGG